MSKVTRTNIEWADFSANPIRSRHRDSGKVGWHCERVSGGCARCYSATLNKRFGTGLDYAADQTPKVEFFLDEKCLQSMLTFKPKGPFKNGRTRAAVFPFDMTDVFGSWVPDSWIRRLWDIFRERGDVDWIILTKRSERMREIVPTLSLTPLANVYLLVSVEDQTQADKRIPDLLATPAAVRGVSAEPLLGPIDFTRIPHLTGYGASPCSACDGAVHLDALEGSMSCPEACDGPTVQGIDGVIVGGESGPKARPCDVSWIRSIKDQCQAAGVPVFVKQLGSKPKEIGVVKTFGRDLNFAYTFHDRKGGDPSEWPKDLRVREMPR